MSPNYFRMPDPSETNVSLSIPFPSAESALLVYDVLSVDKELKGSGVQRKITTDGVHLLVNFHGAELKRLRVALNTVFKNILLIVQTIEQFESK